MAADLAAGTLDQRHHLDQRRAGRDHVVDEHHALAGLDREAAAQLAPCRAVGGHDLLGEDAAHPGRRPTSKARITPPIVGPMTTSTVARRRRRRPGRPSAGTARSRSRPLQDLELLHVAIRVAAALELEVALSGMRARALNSCSTFSAAASSSLHACGHSGLPLDARLLASLRAVPRRSISRGDARP